MKTPPWRTVLPVEETGRFTREQLETAVNVVMERRRAYAVSRPLMVRERGPGWGAPPPPAPPGVGTPEPEPEPYVRPRRGRGRRRPEAGR
ncbi:MAG TPA: hypothetical protein VFJ82_03405 [Longimicrobium sp.]|nr:hypothetical protein [Longimicrobium sp.]